MFPLSRVPVSAKWLCDRIVSMSSSFTIRKCCSGSRGRGEGAMAHPGPVK